MINMLNRFNMAAGIFAFPTEMFIRSLCRNREVDICKQMIQHKHVMLVRSLFITHIFITNLTETRVHSAGFGPKFYHGEFSKNSNTRCPPKRHRQKAKTQIRPLLQKQSYQGLSCLLFFVNPTSDVLHFV